jgi:hypothetical protein
MLGGWINAAPCHAAVLKYLYCCADTDDADMTGNLAEAMLVVVAQLWVH